MPSNIIILLRRTIFRFRKLSVLFFPASVFFFAFLLTEDTHAKNVEISLDPDAIYQTITGWEATFSLDSREFQPPRTETRDDEIIERLINEIGINRIRVGIRSGTENVNRTLTRFIAGEIPYERWRAERYAVVNDNDDSRLINWAGFDFTELDWRIEHGVLPMREMLRDRGEKLFFNLNYVAFTNQIKDGEYLHDDPEEYGEFVLATYLHIQEKYGFVPDAWEVILEPDLVPQWRRDPKLIGRAIVAAARRLKENGFTPVFIAPSVTNMDNAVPFFDALASVPGALEHVRELSYHRYGGRTLKNLRAISARAEEAGISTGMLEWWFGNATYEVLYEDLVVAGNTVWQGRLMVEHFDLKNAREGVPLRLMEDVRYTRQYTVSVRSGAVRIGAVSTKPGAFDPLAFVNPDGSYTIVVKAKRAGEMLFEDLPPGSYRISYAVASGSVQIPDPVEQRADSPPLAVRMPGAGVITITSWKAANP